MKRVLFLILIICTTVHISDAQLWKLKRWEATFGVGPSFFFSDIGGYTIGENFLGLRDISYHQTRFNVGGNIRYRLSRTANLRLGLTYAMLHATDERGSNESRQFEATTHLFEPALIGEYYFIKNRYESSYLFLKGKSIWALLRSLDFYVFTGVGGAAYSVNGNNLLAGRDQATEGITAVIPAGAGATLIYSPNVNFGVELGGRYTFSDYIDGYHSEQYSKANDVYYFLNFTFTYKLKSSAKGLPRFR
ncbi:MAG: hypothetical protein ACOXZV_07530 [Bacteroidales bacterium]|jgi:hypothetical protein